MGNRRAASAFSQVASAAAAIAVITTSWACSGKNAPSPTDGPHHKLTLLVTAELRGSIEPCGCNSDPLGDLARTAALIDSARSGKSSVLYIDGGSMLFSEAKLTDRLRPQEELKSALLKKTFADKLAPAMVGLGPLDLSLGPKAVAPPRHAVNVSAASGVPLEAPKVQDAGGVKVGLFGVVSASAMNGTGVEVSDPIQAAQRAVDDIKKQGAQLIVGVAHMTRSEAISLARAVKGIDFLVVGHNVPEPNAILDEPQKAGDTWLLRPANRGQVVTRVDLTYRGAGPVADAIGKVRAEREIATIDTDIAELEKKLAAWSKDPDADPAFLAGKRAEIERHKKRRELLSKSPVIVPERGSYFVFEQVRINKKLPCDKGIVTAKQTYDAAANEANVKAAAGKKPDPPAKGAASYVGMGECVMCHKKAGEFWKTTKHQKAWDTLVVVKKEFNLDCIYCHVTGFDKPGGSNLAFNENLRDVQCETCHGPGSLHVEADGEEKVSSLTRTPEKELCQTCHNEEHSDTFQYEAYLRDVTGRGHGERFRSKLGDGPTGLELRTAALEKAGKEIGAGCPK